MAHRRLLSESLRDTSAAYTDTMALLPDVDRFDAAHYGIRRGGPDRWIRRPGC